MRCIFPAGVSSQSVRSKWWASTYSDECVGLLQELFLWAIAPRVGVGAVRLKASALRRVHAASAHTDVASLLVPPDPAGQRKVRSIPG